MLVLCSLQYSYIFWTDWEQTPSKRRAMIERATLDGRNRTVLVNELILWTNGLSVDPVQQKIYWCDAYLDRIERMDFNGEHREVLID